MEHTTHWTKQSKRDYQEDRMSIIDTHGYPKYYAVYDGHGGADTSEYLKNHLGQAILAAIASESDQDLIMRIIKRVFRGIDRDLYKQNIEDGSTCTIVIVWPHKLLFINLGDSRSVYFDTQGTLIFQTKDHKPDEASEKRRISAHGNKCTVRKSRGDVHRVYKNVRGGSTGLALSRAMGDFDLKGARGGDLCVSAAPVMTWVPRRPGFLLIGSDGIWDCEDVVFDGPEDLYAEIGKIISKTQDPSAVSALLKRHCKDISDNQTLIVVDLGPNQLSSNAYSSMRETIMNARIPHSTVRTLGTHSALFTRRSEASRPSF